MSYFLSQFYHNFITRAEAKLGELLKQIKVKPLESENPDSATEGRFRGSQKKLPDFHSHGKGTMKRKELPEGITGQIRLRQMRQDRFLSEVPMYGIPWPEICKQFLCQGRFITFRGSLTE